MWIQGGEPGTFKVSGQGHGARCGPALTPRAQFQHNTDTDLKTLHVWPKVSGAAAEGGGESDGGDEGEAGPATQMLECSLPEFRELVKLKVRTFGQQRGLHRVLKEAAGEGAVGGRRRRTAAQRGGAASLSEVDAKLVRMEAPTPEEDRLYNSVQELDEKLAWLGGETQRIVKAGQLNGRERKAALESAATKLAALEEQLAAAAAGSKKHAKLTAAVATMQESHRALTALVPVKHERKGAMDVAVLERRAAELQAKVDSSAASIDEMSELTKSGGRIARLLEEQAQLCTSGSGTRPCHPPTAAAARRLVRGPRAGGGAGAAEAEESARAQGRPAGGRLEHHGRPQEGRGRAQTCRGQAGGWRLWRPRGRRG